MRPDLKREANRNELMDILLEDWKRDSKEKETISKADLFESLFELADIWTPTIGIDQYIGFFETLKFKFLLDNTQIDPTDYIY